MKSLRWSVLVCLLAAPLPAYANNPPRPDGMLGLILLFPVAILGLRLAGVRPDEKSKARRLVTGLILGLAFLLTLGGTEIALLPLVVLLSYGLHRGGLAVARGQGSRRFAVGAGVILFTLFAVANYLVSLDYNPSAARHESSAVSAMRTLSVAEAAFQAETRLDANKNGVGEFGTLEQLQKAGLFDAGVVSRTERWGYRLTLELTGDPARDEKGYFVSAVPLNYGDPPWSLLSLVEAFREKKPFARRTFACDESGVIRTRDLGSARAVTRDEAEKWEPLY